MSRRWPVFGLTVTGPGVAERWVPMTRDPFVIGRGVQVDLRMDGAGVWDRHVGFEMDRGEGLVARCQEGAVVMVEGRPSERHRVRNGDELMVGAFRVRVSLAPARRRSVNLWEGLFWSVFLGVVVGQVGWGWWLVQG
ncbi:MAG: hypothetical protein KF833_19330 [Verrucomicrobiae bacterium]|nr:hypothetical protein [Verrucomicrobiae bacterium]